MIKHGAAKMVTKLMRTASNSVTTPSYLPALKSPSTGTPSGDAFAFRGDCQARATLRTKRESS
jgi:hypothetical protein